MRPLTSRQLGVNCRDPACVNQKDAPKTRRHTMVTEWQCSIAHSHGRNNTQHTATLQLP